MNARSKLTAMALVSAALLASPAVFAQTAGGTSGNAGANGTNAAGGSGGDQMDGNTASPHHGKSTNGSLMQKREKGMSADRPASSPSATGKMSQ